MFEWSEEQLMVRDAIRRFIEAEVVPQHRRPRARAACPPTTSSASCTPTFGMDQMARDRFKKQLERKVAGTGAESAEERAERAGDGGAAAMTLIPIIELCHHCPGIVTSMGVSVGLAAGTIMKGGTPAQMERWGLDLLTAEKIGAWAITEPNSGSDALGGMTSHGPAGRRRVRHQRLQDLDHQRPLRRHHRLLRQARRRLRHARSATARCSPSSSTRARPGLEQSKPFRKMGLHSSPTGELFLTDVRVGRDHLLGETEDDGPGAAGSRPRPTS